MPTTRTIDNGILADFDIAVDVVASRDYQYIKQAFGVDGTATIVSASNPLPVTIGSAGTATPVTVSGTATVTGTVNVGTVTTAPATARTSDSIAATLQVDRLNNGLTPVTPQAVVVSAATSGDNTLLAAAGASNIILVHQCILIADTSVTVRFESGASGTALTGRMLIDAKQGFVLPFSPVGWFKTAANTLLNLELSGAIQVSGVLGYTVVT